MTTTIDYLDLGLQAFTLAVGLGGFAAVLISMSHSRQLQRTQTGPYVRVDIGPSSGIPDADIPAPYYEDSTQGVNLMESDGGGATEVSAWFRNYQTAALGFALGVRATFVVDIADDPNVHQLYVEIPYLEHDKCVRITLASMPTLKESSIMLLQLSFYDYYDKLHRHVYGRKGTNALHGRLLWLNQVSGIESTPEGRSRGEGIDYNVGGAY